MEFCKYHGAGNDFIISSNMWLQEKRINRLAVKACDRHYGIGADGFIMAEPSNAADIKMAFYNSDGSEASMCGNGLRCFSKYVWENGIVNKPKFTVETGDGVKTAEIVRSGKIVSVIKVTLGSYSDLNVRKVNTQIGEFSVITMHTGVPHAVVVTDNEMRDATTLSGMAALDALTEKFGRDIEKCESFLPHGTNVDFIMVSDKTRILCSTWERGAGKTLACGTGAVAAAVAAHTYLNCNSQIDVQMPGGHVLVIIAADKTIKLQGEAAFICKGEYYD